jgi:membrane protein implicated in regulation of membrane protease activity
MWWEQLSSFQQGMFIIAVSASFVMLIFLVLMLIGIEGSDFDGVDDVSDVDVINDEPLSGIGGLKILTIRGILAFISMGAWTAYLLVNWMHPLIASAIGIVVGAISAYLLALAFRATYRLESSGNLDYANAIGQIGTVYIRVPKSKIGKGKITLTIQERYIEVDAMTEWDQDLMPKTIVEVIGIEDTTTLIVKPKQ